MAEKNYKISGKKIYAVVPNLKAAEIKAIKNYVALGYEIVEVEAPKKEKKESAYTAEKVVAFLKQKGNEELFAEYERRYNEQAGTNRTKDGKPIADEPKFLKDGTPKKKGFANCIGWFRSLYTFDEVAKTYITVK